MVIQPVEYVMVNKIPFVEGNVIKYVSRWRKKGGVQDLKKARHMLDVLIEHEEKQAAYHLIRRGSQLLPARRPRRVPSQLLGGSMEVCPEIPKGLVEWLDKGYPERCPCRAPPWMNCGSPSGARSVVRFLLERQQQQEVNHLHSEA